jgi:hypothetical protein
VLTVEARLIILLTHFSRLASIAVFLVVPFTAWEHNERTRTVIAHRVGGAILHYAFTGTVLVVVV